MSATASKNGNDYSEASTVPIVFSNGFDLVKVKEQKSSSSRIHISTYNPDNIALIQFPKENDHLMNSRSSQQMQTDINPEKKIIESLGGGEGVITTHLLNPKARSAALRLIEQERYQYSKQDQELMRSELLAASEATELDPYKRATRRIRTDAPDKKVTVKQWEFKSIPKLQKKKGQNTNVEANADMNKYELEGEEDVEGSNNRKNGYCILIPGINPGDPFRLIPINHWIELKRAKKPSNMTIEDVEKEWERRLLEEKSLKEELPQLQSNPIPEEEMGEEPKKAIKTSSLFRYSDDAAMDDEEKPKDEDEEFDENGVSVEVSGNKKKKPKKRSDEGLIIDRIKKGRSDDLADMDINEEFADDDDKNQDTEAPPQEADNALQDIDEDAQAIDKALNKVNSDLPSFIEEDIEDESEDDDDEDNEGGGTGINTKMMSKIISMNERASKKDDFDTPERRALRRMQKKAAETAKENQMQQQSQQAQSISRSESPNSKSSMDVVSSETATFSSAAATEDNPSKKMKPEAAQVPDAHRMNEIQEAIINKFKSDDGRLKKKKLLKYLSKNGVINESVDTDIILFEKILEKVSTIKNDPVEGDINVLRPAFN